jgi:hypothetical protein
LRLPIFVFFACSPAITTMIISTLVNGIRSDDHVCLSPLSIQKTQIPASQKLLKMPVCELKFE